MITDVLLYHKNLANGIDRGGSEFCIMYIDLKRNFDFTLLCSILLGSTAFSTFPTSSDLFRAGKHPRICYSLALLLLLLSLLLLLLPACQSV